MVISGTCTTEYETGSDDGLGLEGDVEVEGSRGLGVFHLFFAMEPSEVPGTSCGSTSLIPIMGTTTGGGAEGVSVNAFTAVMRGGVGNVFLTSSSQEDDKPDARTSIQSAAGVPRNAISSCCMSSACS